MVDAAGEFTSARSRKLARLEIIVKQAQLERDLLDALTQVARSDARECRLLIEAGPVYLLSISRIGETQLEQEAVASSALPPAYKLSSDRAKLVREMGFAKRGGGRRNWRRLHGRDHLSLERAAKQTARLLRVIYGVEHRPSFELVEDERIHPENPQLVDAMRHLARQRNDAARHTMYNAMLNATFLVPLDPQIDDGGEGSENYLAFEVHDSGRPTLGAFTDWGSLRLWKPRGWTYIEVHGSELFELAQERRPVTMRINPEGNVGGELYNHEIQMLVRAVQTFRRRQN